MPANYANLTASINTLAAQVSATRGTEDSATKLIDGFAAAVTAAVTKALTDDDEADQGSVDVATAAIADAATQFKDSADKLGAAVAANPGPPA